MKFKLINKTKTKKQNQEKKTMGTHMAIYKLQAFYSLQSPKLFLN